MSFSWANKLAKNALLSAQKHIDSVLDIQNEEETPDCTTESANGDTFEDDSKSKVGTEDSASDGNGTAPYADVELTVNTTHSSDWSSEYEQKETPVVDSEPNPIRDAHDDAITPLNYSPNTNTPEEECIHDEELQKDSNNIDLSIIHGQNLESSFPDSHSSEEAQPALKKAPSEDMYTVASSDIEVVKQLDDWSVSSGNQWRHVGDVGGVMTTSISPDNDLLNSIMIDPTASSGRNVDQMLATISSNSQSGSKTARETSAGRRADSRPPTAQPAAELEERVAVLEAKLRHKEQQVAEFLKQNERLQSANASLTAKNKQMSNKSSSELKLQKQLAEKEKELNDLMNEGKCLSEQNGKQAKELRRLRQQIAQLSTLESARDSALAELQAAHRTIQDRAREIETLKESVKRAEGAASQLRTESELNRASTSIVEKFMAEKNAEVETLTRDLQRTRDELKSAVRAKAQLTEELQIVRLKLLNKRAHDSAESDRERGQDEDLAAERARNIALTAQIRQLEMKIEVLMNSQHDIASQISEANLPLLNNIAALEEKISTLERQNDTLTSQLRTAKESADQRRCESEVQLRAVAQRLDEAQTLSAEREAEAQRAAADCRELRAALESADEELRAFRAESARKCREADERCVKLAAELRDSRSGYADLERQYADLLKSVMSTAATGEPAGCVSLTVESPQPLTSSTKLGDLAEDEDEAADVLGRLEAVESTSSKRVGRGAGSSQKRLDNAGISDEMNVVLMDGEPWQRAQSSQIGALISHTKSKSATPIRPNAQSDSAQQSANVEFLRNELEDAHEQLYQLREKFDRLLELYGGCLENIDELKYDNEDLRKLCKDQAIELSTLKRG